MAFNINEFKTAGLTFGGARPSLFQLTVSPPVILGLNPDSALKFQFLARAAELPASTVSSFNVSYFGREIKFSGERTFADWRVTIMNDEDFAVRSMFEAWLNSMNSMESNIRRTEIVEEGYKSIVDITQFSKNGDVIRAYQLIGAFPTSAEAIALDWNNGNQTEEFVVNFAYDYWLPVGITELYNPYFQAR